jgi:S-adenosyl-L-methionine hydrolase (adenosine-forming)
VCEATKGISPRRSLDFSFALPRSFGRSDGADLGADPSENIIVTMRPHAPIVALLTDFGTVDHYAGAVKGMILREAPTAAVVDITHDVAPGDVDSGSRSLACAAPAFPEGTIFLAVVDPGVGGPRNVLVAVCAQGTAVAPDNGLLTDWIATQRNCRAYRLTRAAVARGTTFHARDIFAPLAGSLAAGRSPSALGLTPVSRFVRLPRTRPARSSGQIRGHIARVDRFGDLVTDIPTAWLPRRSFVARVRSVSFRRFASHYQAIPPGEVAFVAGSDETLEIAALGASAAEITGAGRADAVRIDIAPSPGSRKRSHRR